MKAIFKQLKRIRVVNAARRFLYATTYFNKKYIQILKWSKNLREDTNYTYDLTEDNILYLAHTISVATNTNCKTIIDFINEARNDVFLKEHILTCTQNSKFKVFADSEVKFGRRIGWYAFVRILKPKIVVETGVDKVWELFCCV